MTESSRLGIYPHPTTVRSWQLLLGQPAELRWQ